MSCCIVVPVYKPELNETEIASFKRLLQVLPDYVIYLVCPASLNCDRYFNIQQEYPSAKLFISPFKDAFFKSIDGYNKLLMNRAFYKRFIAYNYMLLYQLDAWVFKNELEYWCSLNYDYIGAPWFADFMHSTRESAFYGVGNGGFSLRKIKSHIKVLHSFAYITSIKDLWQSITRKPSLKKIIGLPAKLTFINNTFFLFNNHTHKKYYFHEDFFWGIIASKRFGWFRVPDGPFAGKFSMEVNAPFLYELNDYQLPFGCHAWERIEPQFWQQFIDINNVA